MMDRFFFQVSSEPEGKSAVDLIVVRENTECLVRIMPESLPTACEHLCST